MSATKEKGGVRYWYSPQEGGKHSVRFRFECIRDDTTIATAIQVEVDRGTVVAIIRTSVVAGLALAGIA